MNISRVWQLACMSLASFFWASCGSDSNSQGASTDTPEPDSSAGIAESSYSNGNLSSAEEESSSSTEPVPESSADVQSSSSEMSSSSAEQFVLAKDTSVTCTRDTVYVVASCAPKPARAPRAGSRDYCMNFQEFLSKDTTVAERILTSWEKSLESCGEIFSPVAVYGVFFNPCQEFVARSQMTCTDGGVYNDYWTDGNRVYTSEAEYNEALGISSSSVAKSSSSAEEPMVRNCPKDSFALFTDILSDVQKELYTEIVNWQKDDPTLTEADKAYLDSLLDHENKTLKGRFMPYREPTEDDDYFWENNETYFLENESVNWFSGYIAKNEECTEGTPTVTKLYQERYDKIFMECVYKINDDMLLARKSP